MSTSFSGLPSPSESTVTSRSQWNSRLSRSSSESTVPLAESTMLSPSVGFTTLAEAIAVGGTFITSMAISTESDSPSSSVTWKTMKSGAVDASGHECTRRWDGTSQSFLESPSESASSSGCKSKHCTRLDMSFGVSVTPMSIVTCSSSSTSGTGAMGAMEGGTFSTWIGTISISVPSPSSSNTSRVASCMPDAL